MIEGSGVTSSGNFTGATREEGEPHDAPASLWWEWKAPFTGGVGAEVINGSQYAAVIAYVPSVFQGLQRVSTPAPVLTTAGIVQGYKKVSFRAVSGQTYYLAIIGRTNEVSGTTSLRLLKGPAHDDFSQANGIGGTPDARSVQMFGATPEPGEPSLVESSAGASVWYRWSTITLGKALVSVRAPNSFAAVGIFRGSSLDQLTLLQTGKDMGLGDTSGFIQAFGANEVFHILVTDRHKDFPNATLNIQSISANDDFAGRIVLEGPSALNTVSTPAATRESWEEHPFQRSLWWEWTAPFSGGAAVDVTSDQYSGSVIIYEDREGTMQRVNDVGPNWNPGPRISFRAVQGQKYYFVVASDALAGRITIRTIPGPVNDEFAAAAPLAGATSASSTLIGATLEPWESLNNTTTTSGSVWWKWTPTQTKGYNITGTSGTAMLWVNVFKGDRLENLSSLGLAELGNGNNGTLPLRAQAGETYYIRISDWGGQQGTVTVRITAGPDHDDFAGALPVTGSSITGNVAGATLEAGEVSSGRGMTVWHKYVPEVTGGYQFSLGAGTDSASYIVDLFRGPSLLNLTRLGSVQNNNGIPGTERFRLIAGETYYVRIDPRYGGGSYNVAILAAAANDEFAAAEQIEAGQEISVDTRGAGQEPGEPDHGFGPTAATLWYEFNPEAGGGYYLEADDQSGTIQFAVYRLAQAGFEFSLVPVTLEGFGSLRPFRVQGGSEYKIALINRGNPGRVSFALKHSPPHDDFANAALLGSAPVTEWGRGATTEPGEPPTAGGGVWYRWTAPAAGTYTAIGETAHRVAVFRGNTLSNLDPVGSGAGLIETFAAAQNEVVFIHIRAQSELKSLLRVVPAASNDVFANRIDLDRGVTNTVERFLAGLETNEPLHWLDFPDGGTIWWSFTSATSGPVRLETDFGTGTAGSALAVYKGDALTSLQLIASRAQPLSFPLLTFFAEAGVDYKIAQFHSSPGGSTTISAEQTSTNDLFANAAALETSVRSTNWYAGATIEPGEPLWADPAGGTLWFKWIAPESGTFHLTTLNPRFFWDGTIGQIAIFQGATLPTLEPVEALTNHYPQVEVAFKATAGEIYHVALVPGPQAGAAEYFVTMKPGNPHDDLRDAQLIVGLEAEWSGNTTGATVEPGERDPFNGGASVWGWWIAPVSGNFRLMPALNSTAVFRRESPEGPLINIGRPGPASAIEFTAEAGAQYYFQAITPSTATAPFRARLGLVPPNDSAAKPAPIQIDGELVVRGTTWVAMPSGELPTALWWRWRAPADAMFEVEANAQVRVQHEQKPTIDDVVVPDSDFIGGRLGPTNLTMVVTAGVDYLIAAGGSLQRNLAVNFKWTPIPRLSARMQELLPNHLRLATTPWISQTADVKVGPDALKASVTNGEVAAIEGTFYGRGSLKYWAKVDTNGPASMEIFLPETGRPFPPIKVGTPPSPAQIISGSDWRLYTLPLAGPTNVVRWQLRSRTLIKPHRSGIATGWIDGVEFVRLPPNRPRLSVQSVDGKQLRLGMSVEFQRNYSIEYSTNFLDWVTWTNFLSTANGPRTFLMPEPEGPVSIFFRGVIK